MNMIVADVTRVSRVRTEDEVVLLGTQGGECITAESIAEKINTINYEITTRISPLLPRIITSK
jgi:alanine racemase